jgi:hypothetical protein
VKDIYMKQEHSTGASRLKKYRQKQIASGAILTNNYLPSDLIKLIDQEKRRLKLRGRTEVIKTALRYYFATRHPRA